MGETPVLVSTFLFMNIFYIIIIIWILCAIFSAWYLHKHEMIRSFQRPFTIGDLLCFLFMIVCIFLLSPIITLMCFTEWLEEYGYIIAKPFSKILNYEILKEKEIPFD